MSPANGKCSEADCSRSVKGTDPWPGPGLTAKISPARAWCNGCTRPFQGLGAGSSPAARLLRLRHALLEDCAQRASARSGTPPMAVCADHLAFRDLVEDALPPAVPKGLANIEELLGDVVELQDHGIALLAVDAGVRRRPAPPAHVVSLASALAAPGELLERLERLAYPAPPGISLILHRTHVRARFGRFAGRSFA